MHWYLGFFSRFDRYVYSKIGDNLFLLLASKTPWMYSWVASRGFSSSKVGKCVERVCRAKEWDIPFSILKISSAIVIYWVIGWFDGFYLALLLRWELSMVLILLVPWLLGKVSSLLVVSATSRIYSATMEDKKMQVVMITRMTWWYGIVCYYVSRVRFYVYIYRPT